MSLQTFFLENQVISDEKMSQFYLRLSSDDLHHGRVLRLRSGEHIAVVDASSDYFECEIVSFDDDGLLVSITSKELGEIDLQNRVEVILFQGMPKAEKFETVIRQGTEIGIDGFIPFISERCVSRPDKKRGEGKAKRWSKIAKSAAMQSGRRHVPEVCAPLTEDETLRVFASFDFVIVFWEECGEAASLRELAQAAYKKANLDGGAKVAVVIGPEGGLAEREIDLIKSSNPNVYLCSLGNNILRTETAALIGPALFEYELGALGNTGKGIKRSV